MQHYILHLNANLGITVCFDTGTTYPEAFDKVYITANTI